MAQVAQKTIIEKIISSLQKAQKDYAKMSGGYLCNAEYWLTARVAEGLWEVCGNNSIKLESSVSGTIGEARSKQGRRANDLRQDGRYDIVLYKKKVTKDKKNTPRVIIEIKNSLYSRKIQSGKVMKDVKRIVASMRVSHFQFGVVGYGVARNDGPNKDGKKQLEDHAQKIEKKAKKEASGKGLHAGFKYKIIPRAFTPKSGNNPKGKSYAWMVGCVVISKIGSAYQS